MDVGHLDCDVIGLLSVLRGHGAHGAHHGAFKGPGLDGLDIGLVHGDVAALGDVSDLDALPHQRLLKGEGAADEKAHIALLPVFRGVGQLLGEHTVLIHAVPGDVRADAAPLAHIVGQGLLPPDDLQNGAGKGVPPGILLEVGGVLRGQDDQIGLGIAPAHPGGGKVDPALPDQLADLRRLFVDIGGNVKCHTDIPPDRL